MQRYRIWVVMGDRHVDAVLAAALAAARVVPAEPDEEPAPDPSSASDDNLSQFLIMFAA